ncbi:MAG: 2Fe-2S iron-sulfur cluster binding domain-containing protein [Deltaproteobacteria bacterium]|nr:2Fe-2S iron-sulfur cluster binding domain-containing protein [Deltaproteobacteria bacterium]
MPHVTFVNEHREAEVAPGRRVSDIARELGICLCREEMVGTGIGNCRVWVEGQPGAVSPPSLWERLRGARGWRRLANRARVLGDVRIWTQQGIGSRAGIGRELAPLPEPAGDPAAPRFDHESSAAGTAWNPYGHPHAVGSGTREPPKYEAPAKKKAPSKGEGEGAKAAAAKPAKTKAEAEPEKPAEGA